MTNLTKRFAAFKRAKQLSPGSYSALIKKVKLLDNGNYRWDMILTGGEVEGIQVSQLNVCNTEGGMSMLFQNLELLGIDGEWEEVQSQLQTISDWSIEIQVVHSEQLDRSGNPYVNVYLTKDMRPKTEMVG